MIGGLISVSTAHEEGEAKNDRQDFKNGRGMATGAHA